MNIVQYSSLVLFAVIMACKPGLIGSDVSGESIDQLHQRSPDAAPAYAQLVGPDRVLRVGLFFSLDKDPSVAFVPANPEALQGQDYAFRAYDYLNGYFRSSSNVLALGAAEVVMDQNDEAQSLTKLTRVRFQGRGLNGSQDPLTWEITLGVGPISVVNQQFGKAMAESQIAILNGHFYGGHAQDGFAAEVQSIVYQPVMDAFAAAKAGFGDRPYRIVIFNGCGSEALEDYVLSRYGNGRVDLVGQRAMSDYKHFNVQIVSYLAALVEGKRWTDAMASFKVAVDQSVEVGVPVLRSN